MTTSPLLALSAHGARLQSSCGAELGTAAWPKPDGSGSTRQHAPRGQDPHTETLTRRLLISDSYPAETPKILEIPEHNTGTPKFRLVLYFGWSHTNFRQIAKIPEISEYLTEALKPQLAAKAKKLYAGAQNGHPHAQGRFCDCL